MKSKRKDRKVIGILVVALLFMAVGFATYTSTLYIGGENGTGSTATIKKSKWSVHYVTSSLDETGKNIADAKVTTHTLGEDDFTFAVELSKPGDKYVAKWNVTNDGTYDAVLNAINMSTLTAAQQKYLKYTISYDGTEYTASNTSLALDLAVGGTKEIVLTLEYLKPDSSDDLPKTDDDVVTVSGSFVYNEK